MPSRLDFHSILVRYFQAKKTVGSLGNQERPSFQYGCNSFWPPSESLGASSPRTCRKCAAGVRLDSAVGDRIFGVMRAKASDGAVGSLRGACRKLLVSYATPLLATDDKLRQLTLVSKFFKTKQKKKEGKIKRSKRNEKNRMKN